MRQIHNSAKATIILMLALIAAPSATGAQEVPDPSYTYISLEYAISNVWDGSTGKTLGYSYEFLDRFHIFGGFQKSDVDVDKSLGITSDKFDYLVAAGFKQRIGPGRTLQYRAGYANSKSDVKIASIGKVADVDVDGYYLEFGIRTLPRPNWELDAFVARSDIGPFETNLLWVTVERRITKNLGLNVSGRWADGDGDSESVIFAARYHF